MADQQLLAQRFEEQRGHLRAVAYRMLGSLADPERLSRLEDVAG